MTHTFRRTRVAQLCKFFQVWLLVSTACDRDSAPKKTAIPTRVSPGLTIPSGWYRARVTDGAVEVPFLLQLPDAASGKAIIKNGDEELPVEFTCDQGAIRLNFPLFRTEILAQRSDSGGDDLTGVWQSHNDVIKEWSVHLNFSATHLTDSHPPPAATPPGQDAPLSDFIGDWTIEFEEIGGGSGRFNQKPDGTITGALLPPQIGDSRYLSGQVKGNAAVLSTFDGNHAYRVELLQDSDGEIHGRYTYPITTLSKFDIRFKGVRDLNPSRSMPPELGLKPGKRTVSFPMFKDLPLRGKPHIIDIYASWCTQCVDATPFLKSLYATYHSRGLEIVSLAYEFTENRDDAEKQIAKFRAAYQVPWEIRAVLGTDETVGQQLPPELDVKGTAPFPIAIFIGADGVVAGISTGFVSAAAGPYHDVFKQNILKLVEAIVPAK